MVQRIATSLLQQVAQPITIERNEVVVGTSIGIAVYPDDASDSEELIRIADKAMYTVKHSGKNNFGFVLPDKLN